MITAFPVACRATLIALVACAFTATTSLAQTVAFEKARAAYDEQRYGDAVRIYEELIERGVVNEEAHYNLANAYLQDDDIPNAVFHYRVAWMERPRDPDIRENTRFALNTAGAAEPTFTPTQKTLTTLSRSEWTLVAGAGYVLLALLLMLALIARRAARVLLKICLVPLAAIAVAGAGWWQWKQLELNPEWVVIRTEATARFGPVEGSKAHFKLPLGAVARQTDSDPKGWIELEYDGISGWLKTEYIKQVSP